MRGRSGTRAPEGVRNVRFAPERSQALSRQRKVLSATEAIIEVPRDMYSRGMREFD